MDVLVAPAVQNDSEVELESLGLGLFDVDVDLAECFKDCPEWNVSVYPFRLVKRRFLRKVYYWDKQCSPVV